MRTGIGYDIHRLVKNRELVLGGVKIDFELGLEGHSDADVLTHAICDALLGAAALGDIGCHYPDNDEKYKNISSLKLLSDVKEKINAKNFEVNNVDATIICEKPKLVEYIKEMVSKVAGALGVLEHDINVKATTNEKMGEVGKGEAIAAFAVATIIPSPNFGAERIK
jgi:2-C-methyl-D-erythritol 2,4-cyclodiphosphate synthase